MFERVWYIIRFICSTATGSQTKWKVNNGTEVVYCVRLAARIHKPPRSFQATPVISNIVSNLSSVALRGWLNRWNHNRIWERTRNLRCIVDSALVLGFLAVIRPNRRSRLLVTVNPNLILTICDGSTLSWCWIPKSSCLFFSLSPLYLKNNTLRTAEINGALRVDRFRSIHYFVLRKALMTAYVILVRSNCSGPPFSHIVLRIVWPCLVKGLLE